MQAVILAGGKGTRLAERLNGRPKPLVDVDGIPLLERQIIALKAYGVDDVVILVNHAADQIAAYCDARDNFGVTLTLIDDGEPRGTAGAVLACLDRLADRFLVVYGDTLFNIDVDRFLAAHDASGAAITLFLHPNDHPFDSDLVELQDDTIVAFHAKPHAPGGHLQNVVNAAFYVMEKAALQPWRDFPVPSDFGQDLFPAMLAAGTPLSGYNSFEYIKDLGTPRRLDKVEAALRNGVLERASLAVPQTCVFVDRDGTLNAQRGYVRTPEELDVLPGVPDAIKRLNAAEIRVALVTNQPVLARGECSFETMRRIHGKLDGTLAEAGAFLDRTYLCPHHPDTGFPGEVAALKIVCDCRKPAPGLLLRAARDLNADLARSWMIGDTTSDLLAARRAGVRSILVRTGEAGRDRKYQVAPDVTVDDFPAAVHFIVDIAPRLSDMMAPLLDQVGPGALICLGGAARTGKSTLAAVAAGDLRARGLDAVVLGLDHWLRSGPDRHAADGVAGRFDLEAAGTALRPWLSGAGQTVPMPFYDRYMRQQISGLPVSLRPDSVVILEGVPALLPQLHAHLATARPTTSIYVAAREEGRHVRVIRDLVQRGLENATEAERVYAERQKDEVSVVAASAARADITISLDAYMSSDSGAHAAQ